MTKPDLSRQSIIPSGSTASFDGSISIGEKLLVQDVEFVVSGITSGQTLVYNSTLNKLIPTSIDLEAASTLSSMNDVNFTALASGDTLVFNSATNKWENNNITLDTDSVINTSTVTGSTTTNALDNLNTNKADLVAGKVPASQLPSYVDDVIEGYYYTSIFYEDSGHTITITGETSKIYIDLPTNLTYRWSGSVYIEISSTTLLGTTDRITVTGSTIDIASTYTGQTSIDTIGGITTGSWSGTPINDTYISSASTWNAKQNTVSLTVTGSSGSSTFTTGGTLNIPTYTLSGLGGQPQLNGNGFVRATGTTIDYLSGTSAQFVKADGSLDSNTYTAAYTIPNYYRVDLNLGDDSTGVAGREDKPYRLIQTVWDLIPASSTAQITIEIVGDYTFTTHAILTSVNKDNITFLFKGKIVYAVPATTTSRPLFTFTGTNNNLTLVVPNYTQTTQGGFIYTATSTGHRYIIDNMQIMLGVNTTTVNNLGIKIVGTGESLFTCNNLTISLASDGSGIAGYGYLAIASNVKINTLKITGTPTVALTFYGFTGSMKSLNIENLITDNGYTNLNYFGVTYALTIDNIFVNNINVASNGSTQKSIAYALFKLSSCKNLTIMSGSILNYGVLTLAQNQLDNLNLGELSMNGVIGDTSNPFTKNINLLGNITKTVASQSADKFLIWIGAGAIINGNGFKVFHTDPTYIASTAIIMITGSASPKTTFINNLTIYNSNMITNNANPAFIPIYYNGTETKIVRFRNLVVSSSNDAHTHANTTFIRPYNANTLSTCRIEGNVATNYLQNVTNLTNDADIDLINGYTL